MENFIHGDEFYHELDNLLDDLELNEENIKDLPDDYSIDCIECALEPVVTLSADYISERVDEERFSEDGSEFDRMYKVLAENIDYDKINALMPKLYYSTRKKFKITKADIIQYCK